jgi:hypothetical protein
MNKAFVREPDDTGERHCPACGSLGVAVQGETWRLHVVESASEALAESAFFCPFPRCEVAYFDIFERTIRIEALRHPVYPKDPEAPICACFGLTADDVEADIAEGGVRRVRAIIDKAKGPEAHCRTAAANGQSCVGEVQRYYMKLRGGS